VFFVIISVAATYILHYYNRLAESITPFEFIIITLASFRLIRLFVYDSVARFIRDLFIIKKEQKDKDGNIIIIREKHKDGFKRLMSDLFSCP